MPRTDDAEGRPRPHPAERFAGDSHLIDLKAAAARLRAEPGPARHGHRQVTLFQRSPLTQALFSFEPGGALADHAANGVVVIQCVEGRLDVKAGADGVHHLDPGCLVTLQPRVRHSVQAGEAGALMLLTVCLVEKEENHADA
jgi:Uncharacterized conserved protein, contains double-stranded beta-helix domain